MPVQDDWSDSEDDVSPGTETDVLLGVPDGPVESEADLGDAAVSRIGGLPAFLPLREPAFSSSQCKVCSNPMGLLVQVWCPFEDSPMDRALYVWGCARAGCQRQAGSVRAWRGLRHNAAYAAKLERKTQPKAKTPVANPFSVSTAGPTTFGLGDQIFGTATDTEPTDDASSEESLVIAMASTRVADSFWAAAPSYPAVYLSTISEYIPKAAPTGAAVDDPADGEGKGSGWAIETYEHSIKTDPVFDRFTRRVGFMGEQCLRYELGGTPLPFSRDRVFERLFPGAQRVYSTAGVPRCGCCGGERVFECQVMPNVISVAGLGMEFGTILVFSCGADCLVESCWAEESVLVQWDE